MSAENNQDNNSDQLHEVIHVSGMYENWFLDYASYVIMERAVPKLEDGLKPVQRRILHSMRNIHDGRFHKVANIIGQSMQYHPHGDAAIGDALVNMGQKELMIETQGNWGDVRTGDSAAAPRYIEARLSKFALDVAFNPQTTEWQNSYDGRNREPVALPMKFPLLLAQGAEGIAVGLATKVMPHNFIELLKASIDFLKGKKVNILPDFPTGGMADFSEYNEGQRGGKIRVRAKIEIVDKSTLAIRDIPYSTTTNSLIDSIIKANDKGKIKIKKVTDNTAKDVEIIIELPYGTSPDVTIDALYAFTDCEISISPNTCVIEDNKPQFLSVNEILRRSTDNTVQLLKLELEIRLKELEEKWHFSSLEKIFIENRIYRDIEECETWEAVLEAIDKGLEPHKKKLKREVTQEDIIRLTEIKIKRISRFDAFKADELIKNLESEIEEVKHNLKHLTDFAIAYFQNLIEKYGKGKERKTEIRSFDTIDTRQVAANNVRLYANLKEGFIGTGLRKDEFICECSDLDDVIAFRKDGKFVVTKVDNKAFVGKDLIHVAVWNKDDERTTYNLIYMDGKSGTSYAKRFNVTSIIRDKEYDLTRGNPNSKVHYFTVNPNSESEVVTVYLTQGSNARKKAFDFNFEEIAIKSRNAQGNILTKYPVRKIEQKERGAATLGGIDIWFDAITGRLNTDERGKYLGSFDTDDRILVLYKDGCYEITNFELTNHYEQDNIEIIEKFDPQKAITAIHYDGQKKDHFVKRFVVETNSQDQKFCYISESKGSKLVAVSTHPAPLAEITVEKGRSKLKEEHTVKLTEFIDIKGWKALGNRLSQYDIKKVKVLEPEVEEAGQTAPEAAEGNSVEAAVKNEQEAERLSPGESMEFDVTPKQQNGEEVKKTLFD